MLEEAVGSGRDLATAQWEAAGSTFKAGEARPKRPWIRAGTLELLDQRAALCSQGLYRDADALNNLIKRSARKDRKEWVNEGLQEKYWDPVKLLSKARPPKAVTLQADDMRKS
eukprot:2550957-Alexandrium_andersonii.AAC.1